MCCGYDTFCGDQYGMTETGGTRFEVKYSMKIFVIRKGNSASIYGMAGIDRVQIGHKKVDEEFCRGLKHGAFLMCSYMMAGVDRMQFENKIRDYDYGDDFDGNIFGLVIKHDRS